MWPRNLITIRRKLIKTLQSDRTLSLMSTVRHSIVPKVLLPYLLFKPTEEFQVLFDVCILISPKYAVTIVSKIHSFYVELGRPGMLIPILQMRKWFLREYTSWLKLLSQWLVALRLNPELKKKSTAPGAVCVWGGWVFVHEGGSSLWDLEAEVQSSAYCTLLPSHMLGGFRFLFKCAIRKAPEVMVDLGPGQGLVFL